MYIQMEFPSSVRLEGVAPCYGADKHTESCSNLSNLLCVQLCIARDPNGFIRGDSTCAGVTELGVHRILLEHGMADVITRVRTGPYNHYSVELSVPLQHPPEPLRAVESLMELIFGRGESPRASSG